MRRMLALALALLFAPSLVAQDSKDREADLLRKIDEVIRRESERSRAELLETVRREMRGGSAAPAPAPAARAVGGTADRAAALVTTDLLRRHVEFLASDELEGRNAGYPGNDKASEYIAKVMKDAGLKPGGDEGTYYQKFRLGGKDTRNCVGVLEGTDPELKKEIVVVGAHFDHVGSTSQPHMGQLGSGKGDDKIWNGADDNASGTSAVLGLVRAFGEGGLRSRRTIVFLTFSGEEAGLIGSRWYANHPVAPIGQHVFMLNLDMVGRNPDKPMAIYGVGSAEGGVVRKAVEGAVEKSGLRAKIDDEVKLVGGDSDHSSFRDKRVPYAFFFSGFHADYHRVTDHADKLAYDNMVKVAHTSIHILLAVGGLDERPKFVAGMPRGLRLPDEVEPVKPGRRLGVRVQELDDTECNALGLGREQGALRVDDVVAGGAAAGAGMKPEDYLLSVAGVTIPRAGGRDKLLAVLKDDVKPGRDVDLVVLRKGERLTLKARWSE